MGNSDSKSKFRESVYKLNNEVISAKNLDFWDKLWRIPTAAEEIYTLIQPDDVRMLRRQQPANLATMVHQAVSQLTQIVKTPLPNYYSQATNCVRILTRLIPFILEDFSDEFVEQLFWMPFSENNEAVESNKSDAEDEKAAPNEVVSEPMDQGSATLARQFIHASMGLLFLPDYTVSSQAYKGYGEELQSVNRSDEPQEPRVYPSLLWAPGVGYPDANVINAAQFDKNRKEVLKLLLTCFSGILFQTAESCTSWSDRFLEIATSDNCPFASTLFYSLLNVMVTYDPVGWGVPYATTIVNDDRGSLVDAALQVFLVLLDFGQTVAKTSVESTQSSTKAYFNINDAKKYKGLNKMGSTASLPTEIDTLPSSASSKTGTVPSESSNLYRRLLATLSREEDLQLVLSSISRLLNNYHQSMNTLLPNSIKQITCHQELLVLLWKLLDENKNSLRFVLQKLDTNQLVVPLLFLMYEGRQEPSKVGMIHICTFILLLLSGERDFGVNLNKPFDLRLPLDLPIFSGNHADLLVICLHKIIVSGYEKLNSVYNCFLTIICNISPYCMKLHMVASVRLLRLFKLFAQPRYLFDNEANHHLIFFLLEAFDNIIQYQYEGNQQLVYAIIQNKQVFHRLHDLRLSPSQRRESSSATDAVEDQQSGENISEIPGFVPTEEWLQSWKKKLPLATSLRLLQHLVPQLDAAIEKAGGHLEEEAILYFLRATTMVGLLPVPHPIVIRKYQINQYTHLWFTTFTWGVIFLRNQVLPLFDGSSITLFTISVL
uniref:Uncharacterized protein AlNc14C56G4251 n=1 Tax=Albugo laibachii Nc14 TaxID=890382 RepID=F0WC68_9STRA|nr:conserved hypothetical protein [Albugo laibachii Nc14]|eukprot:CCA18781.1 conserved hypothetical protein [Albugo laibachii Nc14]